MSFIKSNKDFESFLNVFNIVKSDIINYLVENQFPKDVIMWFKTSMETNVCGGKYLRGLTILNTVINLSKHVKGVDEMDEETKLLACICGWCIEILQGYYLVLDDIMDNSQMRRGRPCWYKCPSPILVSKPIGMLAINDGIALESCVYFLLKKYFKSKPYYSELFDLFQDINRVTCFGQMLDTNVTVNERGDLSSFTFKNYSLITKSKSSYYSLYGPVAIGLLISGFDYSSSKYDSMKDLLIDIGEFGSIQDDYLDLYGDPSITGKVGTDIEENKRSWFICKALSIASPNQIQLLQNHYGRNNKQDVEVVKMVYNELNLLSMYNQHQEEKYNELLQKAESETSIPKQIYLTLLKGIYKRIK